MIIGLTGKKKNGKSTICRIIRDRLHKFYGQAISIQINFKDPLLDMAKSIGWNGVKDDRGRLLLQRLGTDVVRDCINENHWVDQWKKSVINAWDKYWLILADDVRFENEAAAVKSLEGKIVYVNTPMVNEAEPEDQHRSERGVFPGFFDLVIDQIKFGEDHLDACAEEIIRKFNLYHL